jgi:hypothetical protein
MADRSTDRERASREAAALELLSSGAGSAHTAQVLASRYGVSIRQGRRYVAAVAADLTGSLTPHALDTMALLSLHRLDLIAGRAMDSADPESVALAIRATKAHTAALTQFRRAISAPVTRFRLPTQSHAPGLAEDDPLPF